MRWKAFFNRAPKGAWIVLWTLPDRKSQWFRVGDFGWFQAADGYAKERAAAGFDVYFGVGAQRAALGPYARGTRDTVLAIPGMWCDIDHDPALVIPRLEALHLPPAYIVRSGRGVHAYWPAVEGWVEPDGDAVRAFQRAVESAIGVSVDHTHDPSRVLRWPGTVNSRAKAPVTLCDASRGVPLPWTDMCAFGGVVEPSRRRRPEKPPARQPTLSELQDALTALDPNPYDTWINVGLALAPLGAVGFELWCEWSRQSPKFEHDEHAAKWDTFGADGGLSPASVVYWAREAGWEPLEAQWGARLRSRIEAIPPPAPPHSDQDHARQAFLAHKWRLHYVPGLGWARWNAVDMQWEAGAHVWSQVCDGLSAEFYARARDCDSAEEKKRWNDYAAAFAGRNKRIAAEAIACHMAPLRVNADDLDADPFLLQCANGRVVDLVTGKTREAAPSDLITKTTSVVWDPAAECPLWVATLQRAMCGRMELVDYLKRWFGYCLTGDTSEQCFDVWHGEGANGKSTVAKILGMVAGQYAETADFRTFTTRRESSTSDVAGLRGARLVVAEEPEGNARLQEGLIKSLTAGAAVKARFLYENPFTYTPRFKLIMLVNHLPEIQGGDAGIWRRVHVVPWDHNFKESDHFDPRIEEKLIAELPGILRWCVEGAVDWRANGLQPPPAVVDHVQSYRETMDPLLAFVRECVIVNPSTPGVPFAAFFSQLERWCAFEGIDPPSRKQVGSRLKKPRNVYGFTVKKDKHRTCEGVELRAW